MRSKSLIHDPFGCWFPPGTIDSGGMPGNMYTLLGTMPPLLMLGKEASCGLRPASKRVDPVDFESCGLRSAARRVFHVECEYLVFILWLHLGKDDP